MLTRDDLAPLTDELPRTFVEHYLNGRGERLRPGIEDQRCNLLQNPEKSLVLVDVQLMDESTMHYTDGAGSELNLPGQSRLDFSADVQGWSGPYFADLGFRCDNPENTRMGRPYVHVVISTGGPEGPRSEKLHRAALDIALKYAKAVVADFPCANPLHLPDSVPESATNFPSPAP
ncbi:hypothetical protein [Kitasatospora sp. NPDC017646]|uniref:hypothetical protein n=1 Tax=Kitasatospora sp. NPDC017646 TaxID=3364024 RepID=UPI0037BA20A6